MRSPATGTSGCSRRTCQKRPPSSASRAGVSRVPWWTCTRSPCSGRRSDTKRSSASRRKVGRRSASALARRSPRATSSRPTPTRLTATRCPAGARSAGWSWTWTPRTRARRPAGSTVSSSPRAIAPDHSVPVTTVPAPLTVNTRSTCRRAPPPSAPRPGSVAATSSSAARTASIPSPVRTETGTTTGVKSFFATRDSRVAKKDLTPSLARAGSARSVFVIATTPRSTPSAASTAACSRVCGITPSSAATVMRKKSMPVAPATIVRTKRSCPGTSTTDTRRPEGRSSGA